MEMTSKVMKVLTGLVCAAVLATSAVAGAATRYNVAHVRHQNSNMVIVVVGPGFFNGSRADQNRWFTGIEQCVKSLNYAGQTLLVGNVNGRFYFHGPNSWHNFLRTINMNWVNARINKWISCA